MTWVKSKFPGTNLWIKALKLLGCIHTLVSYNQFLLSKYFVFTNMNCKTFWSECFWKDMILPLLHCWYRATVVPMPGHDHLVWIYNLRYIFQQTSIGWYVVVNCYYICYCSICLFARMLVRSRHKQLHMTLIGPWTWPRGSTEKTSTVSIEASRYYENVAKGNAPRGRVNMHAFSLHLPILVISGWDLAFYLGSARVRRTDRSNSRPKLVKQNEN